MKDLNFSKRTLIFSFTFVIVVTISGLDFENPSFEVDGGKYFIIFSALIGLLVQFLKKDTPSK
jgi:L-lactate permease